MTWPIACLLWLADAALLVLIVAPWVKAWRNKWRFE